MDKDRLKNIIKENFSIIAIVTVTIMILFSINTNIPLFSGKPDEILNETSSNVTLSNMTDEDKKALDFFYLSYDVILDDLNCISKAAKNKNFINIERCGKFLKENSNRAIVQIDSYNKSTSYDREFGLYKNYLEYYKMAGENLEIGARNKDVKQMNDAGIYIQKANRGMTSLMGPLNETNSNISTIKNGTKTQS